MNRVQQIAALLGFAVGFGIFAVTYIPDANAGPVADLHKAQVQPVRLDVRRDESGACVATLIERAPLTDAAAAEDPSMRPRSWRVSYVLNCADVVAALNNGCWEDDGRPSWVTAPPRGSPCPSP